MPYICSLSGVVEEDFWGPFVTREEALKSCRGITNKEIRYQIYSYTPSDAVHLAPSDRREILKRALGVIVPEDKSAVILSVIGEPKWTDRVGNTIYALTYGGWEDLLRNVFNIWTLRYSYLTDFLDHSDRKALKDRISLYLNALIEKAKAETFDEVERLEIANLFERYATNMIYTKNEEAADWYRKRYISEQTAVGGTRSDALFDLYNRLLRGEFDRASYDMNFVSDIPLVFYRRLCLDPSAPLNSIKESIIGYNSLFTPDMKRYTVSGGGIRFVDLIAMTMTLIHTTRWKAPQSVIDSQRSVDFAKRVATKIYVDTPHNTIRELSRLMWIDNYIPGYIIDAIRSQISAEREIIMRRMWRKDPAVIYHQIVQLEGEIHSLDVPHLPIYDSVNKLMRHLFDSIVRYRNDAREGLFETLDLIIANRSPVELDIDKSLWFREFEERYIRQIVEGFDKRSNRVASSSSAESQPVADFRSGIGYRTQLLIDLAIHRWPPVVKRFITLGITTEEELNRLEREVPEVERYNRYWSQAVEHGRYPTRNLIESLREIDLEQRARPDSEESDDSLGEAGKYLQIDTISSLEHCWSTTVERSDLPLAKRLFEIFTELDILPKFYTSINYDACHDAMIDWLVSIRYREHYDSYKYIFGENGEEGRYVLGLIRAGQVSEELVLCLRAATRDVDDEMVLYYSQYLSPEKREGLPELPSLEEILNGDPPPEPYPIHEGLAELPPNPIIYD